MQAAFRKNHPILDSYEEVETKATVSDFTGVVIVRL